MINTPVDAELIVNLNMDVVGWSGIDQDAAVLCENNTLYHGRDALNALGAFKDDPDAAKRSLIWGEYPRHIEGLLRDGRIALHYLLNCNGMNILMDRGCANAEKYVRRNGGEIHAYVSHKARSGAAFRLGAADPENRHAVTGADVMLHMRRDSEGNVIHISRREKKHDLRKIVGFFRPGKAKAKALCDDVLALAKKNEDVHLTSEQLAAADLLQVVPDLPALKNIFDQKTSLLQRFGVPHKIKEFFGS